MAAAVCTSKISVTKQSQRLHPKGVEYGSLVPTKLLRGRGVEQITVAHGVSQITQWCCANGVFSFFDTSVQLQVL